MEPMISSLRPMAVCLGALLWFAGCGSDDDGVESATERLNPAANACITSDSCLYGHCTTEDGACNRSPGCTLGGSCPSTCYGFCVATPSPQR